MSNKKKSVKDVLAELIADTDFLEVVTVLDVCFAGPKDRCLIVAETAGDKKIYYPASMSGKKVDGVIS